LIPFVRGLGSGIGADLGASRDDRDCGSMQSSSFGSSNSICALRAYVNVMRRHRRHGDAYLNRSIETRSVLDAVSSLSGQCLTQGTDTRPMDNVHGGQAFSAINGYLLL